MELYIWFWNFIDLLHSPMRGVVSTMQFNPFLHRFRLQSELKSGSVVNLITFEVGQCLARIDSLGKRSFGKFLFAH